MVELIYFFHQLAPILLPVTLLVWGYYFFKQKDTPLLLVSILLVIFSIFFILVLPDLMRNSFMYGIGVFFDIPYVLEAVSILVGVWGIIRSVKGFMVTILRSDAVVDRWSRIVEGGAGKGDYVLGTIERMIIDARMPGVATKRENVAIELFGEKRPFLIVQNMRYKEYKMYINARDFGTNLDASWYFMAEPRYLKRTMSKYATGDPQDLTMRVSLFAQQDISAFKSVTHEYVKRALEMLYEELKLDPSGLNMGSRGFLNVW